MPYLTGGKNYPIGNPSVDEGLMAQISPLYPNEAINLGNKIHPLPEDGSIPGMPGWRWIHTPGHTPGHISLFRDTDRTLIAGDAFTTVRQESALAVISQDKDIHGPPAYYTFNWNEAWNSIKILKSLKPSVVITGHGKTMEGEELASQLEKLVLEVEEYTKTNSSKSH